MHAASRATVPYGNRWLFAFFDSRRRADFLEAFEDRRVVAGERGQFELRVDRWVDQEREDAAAAFRFRRREGVIHQLVFGEREDFTAGFAAEIAGAPVMGLFGPGGLVVPVVSSILTGCELEPT